jgi:hypothetical protein
MQAGGSAAVQFVYKLRLLDRLSLELGGFGAPHAGNGSAGLQVEVTRGARWSSYVAGGVGGLIAFGDVPVDGCAPDDAGCPTVAGSTSVGVLHARFGLGLRLAARHRLAFDVGVWRAVRREDEDGRTIERDVFVIPMAGVAWFYAP